MLEQHKDPAVSLKERSRGHINSLIARYHHSCSVAPHLQLLSSQVDVQGVLPDSIPITAPGTAADLCTLDNMRQA
jgi:hypothetical protein